MDVRRIQASGFRTLACAVLLMAAALGPSGREQQAGPIEVDPPGSGGCTLVQAISAANSDTAVGACTAGAGADVIHLPAGTYTLTAVDNSTHGLLTGLPIVMSDITLIGDGAETTIIERPADAPAFRLLRVWHVSSKLTMIGLTLRGGHGGTSGGGAIYAGGPLVVRDSIFDNNNAGTHGGGAIRASVPVTISGSRFANNRAPSYLGGAILAHGSVLAPLNITGSLFEVNSAIQGGAIYFETSAPAASAGTIADTRFVSNSARQSGGALQGSALTLTRVTVAGNRVTVPGEGGGGLYVEGVTISDSIIAGNVTASPGTGGGILTPPTGSPKSVTIIRTTISGNTAATGGGATFGGLTTLVNVTVSGNRASGNGAALLQGAGQSELRNVTIADNESTAGRAGGIAMSGFGILTIQNSILAGNRAALGGPDCFSWGNPVRSNGYTLIGTTSDCAYVGGVGDVVGTDAAPIDARLVLLSDNGGPSLTHMPLAGSPALDAGSPLPPGSDPEACELSDQRGVERPQRAACDIGAVEKGNVAPVGIAQTITMLEDEQASIALAGSDADGDDLTLAIVDAPTHGTLSGGPEALTYTPAQNFNGTDSFTFAGTDTFSATGLPAMVTITVSPVNDPPTAIDDTATVDEGSTNQLIDVLANDDDAPDADETLTVTAVANGAHGTVAIGSLGGSVLYTPAVGYSGSDSFTYTAADGNGGTASATVAVTVRQAADVQITLVESADPVEPGSTFTYVLGAINLGPGSVTNVVVTATLPGGLTYYLLGNMCSRTSDVVTCSVSALAGGQSVSFNIVVSSSTARVLTATAVATAQGAPDPNPANNATEIKTTIAEIVTIDVLEQIGVSDQPALLPSAVLSITEQIGVVDAPVPTPAAMLLVDETIGVQDSPDVVPEALNTPAGEDVTAIPADEITGSTPVSVKFGTVTEGGDTTLTIGAAGPEPPDGFIAGTPAIYFDVSTTAGFAGVATVCVSHGGIAFPEGLDLRLFHYEGGAWVDQTSSKDATTSTICAMVTSFSPFAIFAAAGVEGRMNGEGKITDAGTREHHFQFQIAERSIGDERGKLSYSVKTPKTARRNAKTDRFESTSIGSIVFWNESATFAGTGRWNGTAGYTFEARAVDEGEPGRERDTLAITIRDGGGMVVATTNGTLSHGNIQYRGAGR